MVEEYLEDSEIDISINESKNLRVLMNSEGGKALEKLIADHINALIGTLVSSRLSDPIKISKIAGGIAFGEQLLRSIYGKMNYSEFLEKRKLDVERIQNERMDHLRLQNKSRFKRDAI